MTRSDPPAARARPHPRFTLLLALALAAGMLVVLQWTNAAPLPHAVDDFLGGIAAGLAVSAVIAWLALRG